MRGDIPPMKPYFGLRAYGTAPQVWGGGRDGCVHEWGDVVLGEKQQAQTYTNGQGWTGERGGAPSARRTDFQKTHGATCIHCHAWQGELGAESVPDCGAWASGQPCCGQCFVGHLVEVFRAVRRVLRADGVCWVNLGDSYAGSGKGKEGPNALIKHTMRQGFDRGGAAPRIMTPSGVLPAKNLLGIPWRVALALQADGWWLRSDCIWCLSGGTRVYARTQKGDMPITLKDLARLRSETVRLWNGERWTKLLGMSQTGREDAIEITLRSGERIGCTAHHEWPTQRGLVRADALRLGDVLQTTTLPSPAAPDQPAALDDTETGWLVGLYLAEGCRSASGIFIASHARELDRLERCRRIAQAYHGRCTWRLDGGQGATITMRGPLLQALLALYVAGDSAATKRLTNACWRRSNTFLRALLDGYLHGDGHYDAPNDRWRISFTRNYAWEADLRTLCARLGVPLTLNLSTATCNGQAFPSHRGQLRLTPSTHHNVKSGGEIRKLGRSRGRAFWHVGVEDAPHLFALASGVLTANSKPDCMPESVKDRPTRSHEYVFLLTKRGTGYYYDQDAVAEPAMQADRQRADVIGGLKGDSAHHSPGSVFTGASTRNLRTVWAINTAGYAAAHFATFPPKLAARCILAGSRPGDVVLDPFVGSGTTVMTALRHGRQGIGVELNPEYVALARARITGDAPLWNTPVEDVS